MKKWFKRLAATCLATVTVLGTASGSLFVSAANESFGTLTVGGQAPGAANIFNFTLKSKANTNATYTLQNNAAGAIVSTNADFLNNLPAGDYTLQQTPTQEQKNNHANMTFDTNEKDVKISVTSTNTALETALRNTQNDVIAEGKSASAQWVNEKITVTVGGQTLEAYCVNSTGNIQDPTGNNWTKTKYNVSYDTVTEDANGNNNNKSIYQSKYPGQTVEVLKKALYYIQTHDSEFPTPFSRQKWISAIVNDSSNSYTSTRTEINQKTQNLQVPANYTLIFLTPKEVLWTDGKWYSGTWANASQPLVTGYFKTQETKTIGQTPTFNNTTTTTPATTSITVNKVWADNNDQDGKRPTSINVQLWKTVGTAHSVHDTVTLQANTDPEKNWKHTWTGLPVKDGSTDIQYSVREVLPTDDFNYTVTYNPAGTQGTNRSGAISHGGAATITNTHTPETVTISGGKTWDHGTNTDTANQPKEITVKLQKKNGQNWADVPNQTITTTDGRYSFTGLPKYENQGTEIQYRVQETPIDNYKTTYSPADGVANFDAGSNTATVDITNTYEPEEGGDDPNDPNDPPPAEGNIKISKQNLAGEELSGAGMKLEQNNNGTWATVTNGEWVSDGTAKEFTVEDGKQYRLTETAAPEDYEVLTTQITFTVAIANNAVTINNLSATENGVQMAEVDGQTLIVKNRPEPPTPPTPTPNTFQISKRAVGGTAELPGATMALYKQGDLTSLFTWTSGATAKSITVAATEDYDKHVITAGDYVLKEAVAPTGYTNDIVNTAITFRVNEEGKVSQLVVATDGEWKLDSNTIIVYNKKSPGENPPEDPEIPPTPPTQPEGPGGTEDPEEPEGPQPPPTTPQPLIPLRPQTPDEPDGATPFDPDDPDSPDTYEEGGKTYIKVPNPDKPGKFIYIEVKPVEKTGRIDFGTERWFTMMSLMMTAGVVLISVGAEKLFPKES